jgi:hypothetical protein
MLGKEAFYMWCMLCSTVQYQTLAPICILSNLPKPQVNFLPKVNDLSEAVFFNQTTQIPVNLSILTKHSQYLNTYLTKCDMSKIKL